MIYLPFCTLPVLFLSDTLGRNVRFDTFITKILFCLIVLQVVNVKYNLDHEKKIMLAWVMSHFHIQTH